MSDNYFNPVFTDIGRTVAADDSGQGLQTVIAYVAFGDAKYAVRDAEGVALDAAVSATELQSERWRTVAEAGGSPSPGVLNLVAEVTKAANTEPQFFISEVGFFNPDGVLIAIWSSDTVNLGYRGDLAAWYLSLGLAWFDLPGDMFTVEVLNAPLSQQMLGQARLRNQVSSFVANSGIEYDDEDRDALDKAFGLRVSDLRASLSQRIRTPLCVTPRDGSFDVGVSVTLIGSDFFSADGYSHIGSRFRVYSSSGIMIHDSGDLGAVTQYSLPQGLLDISSKYKWEVAYKGELSGDLVWSAFSDGATFTTSGVLAVSSPPVLLGPSDNSVNVAVRPVFSISSYSVSPAGYDVADAVQFQLFSDEALGDLVWDSGVLSDVDTSILLGFELNRGERYYWRARYRSSILGWTGYSAVFSFVTTRASKGAVMEDGGIVATQYNGYWLVVAPASKRSSGKVYGGEGINTQLPDITGATLDPFSGQHNTDVLLGSLGNSAGAAVFCRSVGEDYFLPNKDELQAVVQESALIDSVDETQGISMASLNATYIWASTEYSEDYAWLVRPNYINDSRGPKNTVRAVVPIRRVKV